MNEKRFTYQRGIAEPILDNLTGVRYCGCRKVCDLLNEVSDRADKNAELYWDKWMELEKFNKVMLKYEIESVEKLDRILLEQKVW